jgi:hypothetical protein
LFEIAAALTTETHSTTEDRKHGRHIGGRSRKSPRDQARRATRVTRIWKEIEDGHATRVVGPRTEDAWRGSTAPASLASPTRSNTPQELRADANRPIGQWRDETSRRTVATTNRQFTGNTRTQPNFGDPLGSGRKQIQGGGKGLKSPRPQAQMRSSREHAHG